jgi:hypothetical protein
MSRRRNARRLLTALPAEIMIVGLIGLGVGPGTAAGADGEPGRWFADRPVAWSEHDDGDVAGLPEQNHIQDTAITFRWWSTES